MNTHVGVLRCGVNFPIGDKIQSGKDFSSQLKLSEAEEGQISHTWQFQFTNKRNVCRLKKDNNVE